MLTVALKGLAGRKVRALLTAIAIVLGVAMISGTYILTDTINNGFNTIFVDSYKNADVVITGKAAFKNTNGNGVETPTFPQSCCRRCRRCRTSRAAAGSVTSDNVKLIGKDGKVIYTGGAPSLGFSVTRAEQQFNPTKLTEGSLAARQRPGRDRQGHRVARGLRVGDPIGSRRSARSAPSDLRDRRVPAASADRRRDFRALRPARPPSSSSTSPASST